MQLGGNGASHTAYRVVPQAPLLPIGSFRRLHSCLSGRSAGSTPACRVVLQAPLLPIGSFRRMSEG